MESQCQESGGCGPRETRRKRREATSGKERKGSGYKTGSSWTTAEDEYLMEQVAEVKNGNWRIVCKRMNKRFLHVRRTGVECKVRFESLPKVSSGTLWTANEDLALLCACCAGVPDWPRISRTIPTHELHELKRRLQELLHEVAVGAKRGELRLRGPTTPCERLQVFLSVKLLCEAVRHSQLSCDEAGETVRSLQPTQEECLRLLDGVDGHETSERRPQWTLQRLTTYIETVLEKLENSLPTPPSDSNPNPEPQQDSGLDEVMHGPRVGQAEGLSLPWQYWWLPAYVVGYQCYVLALCYVIPPAQP